MPELYGAYHSLIVGQPGSLGLDINSLDISARVKKKANSQSDTAEIRIFKLSEFQRRRIEQLKNQAVILDCGYKDFHGVIFKGKLLNAYSEQQSTDWVTVIKAEDYSTELSNAVLSIEVNGDTSSKSILNKIAKELGIKIGDITLKGIKDPKAKEIPLIGSAQKLLTKICQTLGLYWHITDGLLWIAPMGTASRQEVIEFGPKTGLVGSPKRTTSGIEFTSRLYHTAQPGSVCVVNSRDGGREEAVMVEVEQEYDSFGTTRYTKVKSLYRGRVLAA